MIIIIRLIHGKVKNEKEVQGKNTVFVEKVNTDS